MNISRRSFFQSACCFGAGTVLAGTADAASKVFTKSASDFDECLTVFLSDVHIRKGKSHQRDVFFPMVKEILNMKPLPKRIVVFGDLAFNSGKKSDYEESYKIFKMFMDAGIEVTVGMGNHDRRSTFLEVYEGFEKRNLIPGSDRIVTVASDPNADILMLDGLQGLDSRPENNAGPVSGKLDKTQIEWLRAELPKWPRKVFVASHFPIHELRVGTQKNAQGQDVQVSLAGFIMEKCPNVKGYFHGHDHRWYDKWTYSPSGAIRLLRSACLPSTGHWGEIGYATFRTTSAAATLSLEMKDFFMGAPIPRGDSNRPEGWDALVNERTGDKRVYKL